MDGGGKETDRQAKRNRQRERETEKKGTYRERQTENEQKKLGVTDRQTESLPFGVF
jgi:hypothetical protein